jgi:hypothetical protein
VESFEDPFAVKLLPDTSRFSVQARFFNLGRSASGIGVFTVYRTNGKQVRVLYARPFDPEEQFFYQRQTNRWGSKTTEGRGAGPGWVGAEKKQQTMHLSQLGRSALR